MNKAEMAAQVARRTGLTHAKAHEVIDAIFNADPDTGIIARELQAERPVTISGFGKFETRRRQARHGRNPATGAAIRIPPKTAVAFKAAKGFRGRIER